jgi:threonine dehydrogenase-like Zn-dependent dehydrogenase
MVQGGTSGIGVTAIQLAKAMGAQGAGHGRQRREVPGLPGLGADHAINYKTQDFAEEAKQLTGGNGVDVILDMVAGATSTARSRACRGRPPRHHRGAGRDQERVQRRPGAAPPPADHGLDAAPAPGGLQGAIAAALKKTSGR